MRLPRKLPMTQGIQGLALSIYVIASNQMMLLISECLGIADLLFNFGLCHQE